MLFKKALSLDPQNEKCAVTASCAAAASDASAFCRYAQLVEAMKSAPELHNKACCSCR